MKIRSLNLKSLLIISICLMTAPAQAGLLLDTDILDTPILGGNMLVAEDGHVTATFLGSSAGYFNTLYFVDSLDDETGQALFDKSTATNTTIDLGYFTAGSELLFRLDVRNTGDSFFIGDGSRNADGLAHASAISTFNGDSFVTDVGFEDLLGGGDLDFNDFMFSLNNVIDPPAAVAATVPAPSIILLLATGMLGLGLQRRHI